MYSLQHGLIKCEAGMLAGKVPFSNIRASRRQHPPSLTEVFVPNNWGSPKSGISLANFRLKVSMEAPSEPPRQKYSHLLTLVKIVPRRCWPPASRLIEMITSKDPIV